MADIQMQVAPRNPQDALETPSELPADKEIVISEDAVNLPSGLTPNFVVSLSQKWNADFEGFFKAEREKIKEFWRMSRSQITGGSRSRSKVVVPLADNIIQTIVARMVPAIWTKERLVDAVVEGILASDPEDRGSTNSVINKVEDFVNQTLVYTTQSREKAEPFITEAAVAGTAFGREFWEKVKVKTSIPVFETDPLTGQQFEVDTKPVMQTRGHWNWDHVPLFNMAWEPRATNPQGATWMRERSLKSANELKALEQAGKVQNIDRLLASTPGRHQDEDWEVKRRKEISSVGSSVLDSEKVWQIDEFWATVSWRDEDKKVHTQEAHFMIAENTFLVKYEENPLQPQRKPYFAFRYKVRPGEFLGSSALESVESMIREVNENKGRLSDLTTKAAIQPLLVDETSGVDPRNFMSRTNGIIPVESVAGVKPLPVDGGAISATTANLIQDINLTRESTAANEQAQGLPQGGGGTATEARILASSSGSLFSHLVLRAMDEWVSRMAQGCFWMYRQFGEDGDMFVRKSSVDGKPMVVERRDLQNTYIFAPVSPETAAQKADRVVRLKEVAIELANMGVPLQFVMNFYRTEILPLMDVTNGKDLFPDEAGIPQQTDGGVPSAPSPDAAGSLPQI